MVHPITWISIVVIVLAFIFFIVSIIILEFGVKIDKNGEIVIPWYYWVFLVGAGLFVLAFVILQVVPPVMGKKKGKPVDDNPESWVEGNVDYS